MASAKINRDVLEQVIGRYRDLFGEDPGCVVKAPGRINLIGDHTDYNDGFVLPAAIEQAIYIAMGNSNSGHHWYALDLGVSLDSTPELQMQRRGDWTDFVQGAWLEVAIRTSTQQGVNVVISSDLAIGSGLSSSSALTCGVLTGLNSLRNAGMTPFDTAQIAHDVERNRVGLNGGIMDQFAIMLTRPGHLLLLDCMDSTYEHINFVPDDLHMFLLHTNVQRELTSSQYNTRSDECRRALNELEGALGANSFRGLAIESDYTKFLEPVLARRARHVLTESDRVLKAVLELQNQDWNALGRLLCASHASLRDDFEISIPQLDFLVDYASEIDWIYGSRMMGGGFGGCTINIARESPDKQFIDEIRRTYTDRFDIELSFIPISLSGGTQIIQ